MDNFIGSKATGAHAVPYVIGSLFVFGQTTLRG
jgi:hypothetical protein